MASLRVVVAEVELDVEVLVEVEVEPGVAAAVEVVARVMRCLGEVVR